MASLMSFILTILLASRSSEPASRVLPNQQLSNQASTSDHPMQTIDVSVKGPDFKRICYFRMEPEGGLRLSQVDGSLCTHINLAFCRLDDQGSLVLSRPEDLPHLMEVPALKSRYPHLKVLVSLMNEQEEFDGFPKAAAKLENRLEFARSAVEFLKTYQLDGVDLDWEFANFPDVNICPFKKGRGYERSGQTEIVRELRKAFDDDYNLRRLQNEKVEPYLLTMAVAAQKNIMKATYELNELAKLCDWLNIMSYDYFLYKPYLPFTGHNSPLHPMAEALDLPIFNQLSHTSTLAHLVFELQIPRNKIVMGIPTYARGYRLLFKNTSPTLFALSSGEFGGRIPDYLDYMEVLKLLEKEDTIAEFDRESRVFHLLAEDGYVWVSYENEISARMKVRHVVDEKLAGYMTWNLNSDDHLNLRFPLHRAMMSEAGVN